MKTEKLQRTDRIKISHLMFSLEPGGLENGVVNIANGLNREQFEIEIACLERKGSFLQRLDGDVGVFCMEKPAGVSMGALVRLTKYLRKARPDIVNTHNLGPLFYAVLARFFCFGRFRILHGEHGVFRAGDLTWKRLRMRRVLYRACHAIHTVSHSLTDYLVEELKFSPKRIATIINGVDCERFHPPADKRDAKRAVKIPPGSLVIGMVGRLIQSKRHLLVLEAFNNLAAANSELVLLIVGDGGDTRVAVEQVINDHVYRGRIYWVGHQDNPVPYYHAMDLLVMPSSVEGLSNALLEAMACGIPCLAHPACGGNEVIQDSMNGILRRMDDLEEAEAAISQNIRDTTLLIHLGREARLTARDNFSLETMISNYSLLYRDTME